MKATKSLYHISSGIIYVASFVILAILTITNLRFSTYVMNIKEYVNVRSTPALAVGIFLLCLFLLLFLISKFSDQINEKKLFAIFSIVYVIAGIYLLTHINSVLRYDALAVHEASLALHHGDFSTMDIGHYTYRYPHQIGFLIYEYFMGFISHDAKILFGMNLFAVLVINFFMCKITKEIFQNQHKVNVLSITLSFLFLPQFFFITFAYGLIPGLCLLVSGIYELLVAIRTRKLRFMILSSFLLMLAVLMKKNFIIALAACMCYLFWKYLKENDKSFLKLLVLILVVFVAGKAVMTIGFERYTGKKVNKGVPSVLWVAMGTDPDNHRRSGGWYDPKYVHVYKDDHYDREKAAKDGEKMVSGYMTYYKENPQKAYEFFSTKIITTWADPLYESIFSGPKKEAGQEVSSKGLERLFNEEKYDTWIYISMKAYVILLLVTTWIFAVRYLKRYDMAVFGMIFLIGGFLFHLFWETKGQYVYPYIFLQIPASAYVLAKLFGNKTKQKI